MNIEKLYAVLPASLQNLAVTAVGYKLRRQRYSAKFRELLHSYQSSDHWSAAEIEKYQNEKLSIYLNHCRDHVPFYKNSRLSQVGEITPGNAADILKTLPIVSKDQIREHKEELVSMATDRANLISSKTSGTTGKALSFYKDHHSLVSQWAIWFRHRGRVGMGFGDLHVNFTGKPIVPINQKRPPYWRYNRAFRQYMISMVHTTKETIGQIVEFLNSIEPKFYSGYPSIMAEVARQAALQGLQLQDSAKPRFIFPGAEPFLEDQRKVLTDWTGAVISDQYGMTEGVCNIAQCEEGRYHEDFELGFIEAETVETLEDGAIRAKIIATAYDNLAFSFMRYDTGDVAVWEPEGSKCACGRSSKLVRSIEGRSEDFVLTPEGNRIMRFDYIFKDSHDIHEAQVLQFEAGEVVIRYVPLKGKVNQEVILEHVRKYISKELAVRFEEVEAIERESNGKFRSVKSFLKDHQTGL